MMTLRSIIFVFKETATTEIYTLSLHDALPIFPRSAGRRGGRHGGLRGPGRRRRARGARGLRPRAQRAGAPRAPPGDRKSTRLNSSHANISYAVFCLQQTRYHLVSSLLLSTHTI